MTVIVPAILEKSVAAVKRRISQVRSRRYHIDVMDSTFTPSRTALPAKLAKAKLKGSFLVHLMTTRPERYVADAAHFADTVVAHYEACPSVRNFVDVCKKHGVRPGLAIDPATPLYKLIPCVSIVKHVLVMTVVPGRQGSPFVPVALRKVRSLRRRFPLLEISVDGGIRMGVAKKAAAAGADIVSAGSAIFWTSAPQKAFEALRKEVA